VILSHDPQDGFIETETTNVEPLGSHDIVDVRVGDETLRARCESGFSRGEGQKVWVSLDPHRSHFFDAASGTSLRRTV
jgi:multiple sugar transport system ATP-binding protein